jgi:pyruvate,orthophosphate dikinase
MILAEDEKSRIKHLKKLLPYQTKDFYNILKTMKNRPVTVRLLDPPLHEFINIGNKELEHLALDLKKTKASILSRIDFLKESNPMLGHRGCRLGISYPEVTEMQVEALLGAALKLKKEGASPSVEIMIPLISHVNEFINQKNIVVGVYDKLSQKHGLGLKYKIGTMIEVPRACLIAEEIAKHADFFSFGTNDLTQTTFGFSRDDTSTFFESYFQEKILPIDPFEQIDRDGVGKLMRIAVQDGRKTKRSLSIGICGEHGGEPNSIEFCSDLGLNYVSCSPFRVPIARLAAAQVEL